MAEKLSVTIALEGGAEIERQLAGIGEAGMKAFADIQQAAAQVGGFKNLQPEVVTAELQKMGVTGKDAIDKITQAVASATRLESVVQTVQRITTALRACATAAEVMGAVTGLALAGIAAGVIAALPYIKSLAADINKVAAEAVGLDVPIQKFDSLRLSIEAAGISAKGFETAMGAVKSEMDKIQLAQVARDAKEFRDSFNIPGAGGDQIQRLIDLSTKFTPAGKAAAEALAQLASEGKIAGSGIPGTTLQDVQKLGTEFAKLKALTGVEIKPSDDVITQFNKITDALAKIQDPAQRAQAALEFLKGAGAEFEAAFKTGTLEKFKQDITGVSEAGQKTAAEMEQSHQRIVAAWSRLDLSAAIGEMNRYAQASNSVAWERISNVGVTAWNAIKEALGGAADAVVRFVSSLGGVVWDTISAAGVAAWKALGVAASEFGTGLATVISTLTGISWDVISGAGVAAWNLLTGAIQGAIDKLKEFNSLAPSGTPAPAGGGGHAAGGLLGGRGSGTSDSNLAWVSRGEYITPANAVAQPGVLAFLEALRRSGGNLRSALNGMGHFALGGMVRGPLGIPAFAGGGMHAVTINFPGLPEITGLRASSGVVDELRKAAAMAQVRSGGRKPSRFS